MSLHLLIPVAVFFLAAAKVATALSTTPTTKASLQPHWLALPVDQLSDKLGGSGKAKLLWETVRAGVDPLGPESPLSLKAQRYLVDQFSRDDGLKRASLLPTVVSGETVSSCGGRKQLHLLHDGLEVETVIIPHATLPRTTLCISNQVGCDRGCIFCATGKMGLIRNLSAAEVCSSLLSCCLLCCCFAMPFCYLFCLFAVFCFPCAALLLCCSPALLLCCSALLL
jgi:23S rRNA (adenine2503-C2)-methyltransferase